MTESEALQMLDTVLTLAKADAVVASLAGGVSASTRVADNVITQNVQCERASLRVECAYGQSHGAASTDDLSDDALKQTVQRAQAIAKVSPPDLEYMPPVAAEEARKYQRVPGYHDATARLGSLEKGRQLAGAARKAQASQMRLSGGYASGASFHALANSAGLRAWHAWTDADLHATVLGPDGSGWAEAISSNVGEIDVEATARKALEIAQAAQNPQPLSPGKYDVIMSAAAAAELLLYTFWCGFDAKAADEERTFLRGKLGAKIFGDNITVRSNAADVRCPGAPFQDDGLASAALPWIENGVVRNLCYSRYWAKKQGKQPTGWPPNILMDGGSSTIEEMIAGTKRGLLITRFWYIRPVDPMVPLFTGMTRDGLFFIENGKVTRPVQQLRFNANMVEVLNNVETLGPVARTSEIPMLAPALKVRDFNFTSGTKF